MTSRGKSGSRTVPGTHGVPRRTARVAKPAKAARNLTAGRSDDAPPGRPAPEQASPAPRAGCRSPLTGHPKFPPVIVLMGPTASGKTAVAARVARELPCEIVSVDSGQIYKGMDIGTAKPGAELLRAVPHHLLDVVEPHESYSAARFRDDALTALREITERDRIPLLVGGTMLYFQALLEGLNELPEADPLVRLVIDTMAEEQGWPGVHSRLREVDPETAARLDPNDAQRIQRALEVYFLTNKPLSALLRKPKYVYFPYTAIRIALVPSDRQWLHERIARRFDGMLERGLVEEVKRLRDAYGLEPGMNSMRCVGYRQAWDYLEGRINYEQLREQGVAATRQLAKRQLTWLRSMEGVTQFDCIVENLADLVLEYLRRELEALLVS